MFTSFAGIGANVEANLNAFVEPLGTGGGWVDAVAGAGEALTGAGEALTGSSKDSCWENDGTCDRATGGGREPSASGRGEAQKKHTHTIRI